MHFLINNGGNFSINTPNFENIDVGYFATPQIIDVNRDGLNDLIIGNKKGTISYFENMGTQTSPIFNNEISNWGGIDVDSSLTQNGFSSPMLIDINGEYFLFVGSYSGKTYLYNNIDGNLNGTFTELNSINNNVWEGGKNCVTVGDINNDNLVDLLIGNQSGGLALFKGDTSIYNSNSNDINIINVFPNPSSDYIYINNPKKRLIVVFNSLGKIELTSRNEKIDIQKLSPGLYYVRNENQFSKFIKK